MGAKPVVIPSEFTLPKRTGSIPWATAACMVTADFIALSLVYWMAVLGRYAFSGRFPLSFYLQVFPAVSLFVAAFYLQNLYPGVLLHPAEEIRRVFRCVTTVFLLIASVTFLWHDADTYSRFVFLVMWAAGAPFVLMARHIVRSLYSSKPWWGVSAVILGSGPSVRRFVRTICSHHPGLCIAGVLTEREPHGWPADLPPWLGTVEHAPEISRHGVAQYAVLTMPDSTNQHVRDIIQDCCVGFRHVLLVPDFPGLCSLHISAREIGGQLALELHQRLFHTSAAITKRVMDIVGSGLVLLALSPILAIIILLIRLTSPGPIFFGHSRFGRDGGKFKAWKFRSMVPNGDEVLGRYLDAHPAAREEWNRDQKLKHDPRVTTVGKWLRRTSLDEMPQLWNVLVGDMSLVGPRPIVKAEINKYGQAYGLYKRVIPGITGLWQVSGRNNTTYEERVAFDEYYVRNWSVWLDAYILARTVRTVLTGDGAY